MPSSQPGALVSGLPRSAVQIAFAWTSGPGMRSLPLVGVAWKSWRLGAVAPTTTILPRKTPAGTPPRSTCQNGTLRNVPAPPR